MLPSVHRSPFTVHRPLSTGHCRPHSNDRSHTRETRIALFQKKEIRKTLHENEWWFVVVDVVAALTDSANPQNYLRDMRRRDPTLAEAFKGGAENSTAAFGLTPTQYKKLKNLRRENLRDHMTDLELNFSMLGDAATTEIARNNDAQGFPPNKKAAIEGGTVSGNARRELETKSGRKVVSRGNYLDAPESKKRLR